MAVSVICPCVSCARVCRVAVFGCPLFAPAESLTCTSGGWSAALPLCQVTCPTLSQPANTGSCTKTLFAFTFSDTSPMMQLYAEPTVPAGVLSSLWAVSGGLLVSGVSLTTTSVLRVSNPSWLASMSDSQWVQLSAGVQVSTGTLCCRGGLGCARAVE